MIIERQIMIQNFLLSTEGIAQNIVQNKRIMPMITISATTRTITILEVILAACGFPPPNSFEAQVLR